MALNPCRIFAGRPCCNRWKLWREAPLVELKNRDELETWLRKQPREVLVAFVARSALRVLPVIWTVQGVKGGLFFAMMPPLFRSTSVSWYGNRKRHPNSASVAAAAVSASFDAYAAWAPRATSVADFAAAFWSAVSDDARRVEDGEPAMSVAISPLWPQGQPNRLQSLWQEFKMALLATKQDWQMWTLWYDDRLAGRVRDEERELLYEGIADYFWKQGLAIFYAEIRRRNGSARVAGKAPADNAYDEATVFKRKAYDDAIASAIKAYEEAMAPIRNAMAGKTTDEARASVLKAYDEAVASALHLS